MEAADLFVINKSDRPGADRLAREISMMLHLWTVPGAAQCAGASRRGPEADRAAEQARDG